MLGLKLNHVSKEDPAAQFDSIPLWCTRIKHDILIKLHSIKFYELYQILRKMITHASRYEVSIVSILEKHYVL